ncbi:unnamed protein product, partial [Mesorhabditis spiculigera]
MAVCDFTVTSEEDRRQFIDEVARRGVVVARTFQIENEPADGPEAVEPERQPVPPPPPPPEPLEDDDADTC